MQYKKNKYYNNCKKTFIFSFTSEIVGRRLKPILEKIQNFTAFIFILFLSINNYGQPTSLLSPKAMENISTFSDIERFNAFNGKLDINIDLLNMQGRGESEYNFSINRNVQGMWNIQTVNPPIGPTYYIILPGWDWGLPGTNSRYLPGFMSSKGNSQIYYINSGETGTQCFTNTYTRFLLDLNGKVLEFRDVLTEGKVFTEDRCYPNFTPVLGRGREFETFDGSSVKFISDYEIVDNITGGGANANGYVLFPNGTKYRINDGRIDWITDRNGNKTSFTYDTIEGYTFPQLKSVRDSNGRQIYIDYDINNVQYGLSDRIRVKGSTGTEQYIYVSRKNFSQALKTGETVRPLYELFPEAGGPLDPSDFPVLSEIWLPNGSNYKFLYNSYGDIASLKLPTGGIIEYDSSGPNGSNGILNSPAYSFVYRRLNERRLFNSPGSLTNKTTYAYNIPNDIYGFSYSTTTIDNFGNNGEVLVSKSKHHFYGEPNLNRIQSYNTPALGEYNDWKDGREFKVEWLASDGVTILKRDENIWQQRASLSWWTTMPGAPPNTSPPNSPRITQTKTYLLDTNQVSKKEFAYDYYNNIIDIKEYNFGDGDAGSLIRRTHNSFINNTDYINPLQQIYLPTLKNEAWISSDSNGANKVSLTQFEYDNYTAGGNYAALLSRSNVVGHDSAGYGTSFTRRGNVTKVTSYADAQNQTGAISVYSQYDILGNVVKTIDGKGYTATIDYTDRFGSADNEAQSNTAPAQLNGQSTFAFPTSGVNAMGWNIGYTQFDYYTGQPVNTQDINGVISKMLYNDPLDRPTQTVTAIGLAEQRQSTVIYDDANRRIESKGDLNTFNDNLLRSESYYDGLGRTIESRKYESGGSYIISKSVPFTMVQDPETQQWRAATKVSNPYRSTESGQPVWTTSLSDSLGRPIKVITPDGAYTKTEYSGNAVTVTDQAGKKRRSITNALGQLVRVDEPNGLGQLDANGSPVQPTNYTYDFLNNLTQVQQIGTGAEQCGANNQTCTQTRTFVYDSLSRLKQATNPESGLINYQYDNNGNLTSKTDARGVVTTYLYDALNRVTNRNYNNPAIPNYQASPNVTYTYDNLPNAKGKLIKVDNGTSKTEYTAFDILGRVTQSKQTTDGTAYNPMTYGYNLSGALIEQIYPSGRAVKNVLDADGDLALVQSKKNAAAGFYNYAKAFTYTAAGAVSSMQLGNGMWESIAFNSRLQPTQIALGNTAQATNLLKLNFTYNTAGQSNNNGNVLSQTITAPATPQSAAFTATQSYTYDSLNRIKDATEIIGSTQQWKQTFIYDRYGNRTFDTSAGKTTTLPPNCATNVCNPSADPTNNKLIGTSYDNAGNTKTDASGQTFIYDSENKQVKVENGAAVIGEYYYDGDGKRVKKVVPSTGETTIFIYDASGKLVAEYSTQVEPQATAKVSYLTNDHLGSPRITTDTNGQVISRRDFQPFGEEIARTGYGTDKVRQKFTSYERDNETELDFAQARYHNFKLGRFQVPDPENAGAKPYDPQSWNGYVYVRNNPLIYVDPDGLDYKICYNSQNCWTTNDDGFAEYTRTLPEGFIANAGSVYDPDGNKIATYSYFEPADVTTVRELLGGARRVLDIWQTPVELVQPAPVPGSGAIGGIIKGSKIVRGISKGARTAKGLVVIKAGSKTVSYALNPTWKNWVTYLAKRGWTQTQIQEALANGSRVVYKAKPNQLNPGNSMSIVTHPTTGQSLIIDDVTNEIIMLGGKGFLF